MAVSFLQSLLFPLFSFIQNCSEICGLRVNYLNLSTFVFMNMSSFCLDSVFIFVNSVLIRALNSVKSSDL